MNLSPSKKARLAICVEYPVRNFGGTEVLVVALTRGLAAHFNIVLVSRDSPETFAESGLAPFVETHIPWSGATTASASAALAREFVRLQVDLAHFHFGGNYSWGIRRFNQSPLLFVRKEGIPCITTNHGVFGLLFGYCAPQRPLWFKLSLLPFAWLSKLQTLLHVEEEVAVSKSDLRSLQKWYWPLCGKFNQVYHSIIPSEAVEEPNRIDDRQKTIVCVGSIGYRKGQVNLAEAFTQIAARHPDWKLVLAGRWCEPTLVDQIRALGEQTRLSHRIELFDNLSNEEIKTLLQTSAIFAMPSLHEGLGLSLQEALFYGCACIGSRVQGIPDLIQHDDNGLLVPPGDVDQLAAELDRMMSDEGLRLRLSTRGRPSVLEKGMTSGQMVQNYLPLYESILKKR